MIARWKRILYTLVIVILFILGLLYVFFPDWFHQAPIREPEITGESFGKRLLIIAPHPDDETLGGGGVIMKQIQAHKQVKVVVLTSGDGYRKAVQEQFHVVIPVAADFRKLGYIRHEESVHAMATLEVPAKDVIFLGYPDGGVNGMWQENWDYNHPHKALNGCTYSPYPFAFETHAPYCGANVVKNLMQIIRGYQPTDIVYPDPNDVHHDHWATQAFVKYTLTFMQYHAQEWTYLVHRYDWPIPWAYEPNSRLQPPFPLWNTGTHWLDLPLTLQQEQLKLQALKQYRSQERVMEPFLEAFVRRNDLFGTYPKRNIPFINTTPNFHVQGEIPYLFIKDPVGDTFTRKLHGAADIQSVSIVHSGQRLWIALQTHLAISDDISYFIRFRLFHTDQTVTRDDLKIEGGHISEQLKAENSRSYAKNAQIITEGNRLIISLPISPEWHNVNNVMLCAETRDAKTLLDKSAWENGSVAFQ